MINSQDIKLYADYEYSEQVSLNFSLFYQAFSEDDWRAEYDIDHMINVLGNGFYNYDYDAYRVTTAVTYQF